MARNEYDRYDKTIKILQDLDLGDNKNGLFSCFGVIPQGDVFYFDDTGTPWRTAVRGSALVQIAPVHLDKLPVEVISQKEAYHLLVQQAQNQHMVRLQVQAAQTTLKKTKVKKDRWSVVAAAGLLILTAFLLLLWINKGDLFSTLQTAEARLKQAYADRGINISGYKDIPVIPAPGGYNPLAGVSISREVFREFLAEVNSPALSEADAMYQVCVDEGCDPAVALGFFAHESSAGKTGVASYTKSLGNIRCTSGYQCFTTEGNGSFRRYDTWAAGMRDWVQLLKFYKDEWKLLTLEEIVPTYAPAGDNNDEAAYIAAVKKQVDNLRQREGLRNAIAGVNKPGTSQIELPTGNPVREKDMVITQGYHAKHPEVDIARPASVAMGTKIYTTISGVVTVVRNDPLFGNRVLIRNNNFTAHYNHLMDTFLVQNGQEVKRGDIIGLMGNSGNSTGPHLDYELFQGSQRLNPEEWIFRQ